jgi:DNA repair protein RecN (Recombination protein N)
VQRLEIQNLAIIQNLELTLGDGFNVFTGETGAGKSIIVDAIWLLTGSRADAELVRSGEDSLLVSGFWDDLTLSRRVSQNGRSVARIDGEVVSNKELAERAGGLVTVHWQHAAQALLEPKYHREFLDSGLDKNGKATLERYREAHRAYTAAHARLEALRENERERARRADLLRYQLKEISDAKVSANEEETLRLDRDRLANAERIASDASIVVEALEDADVNAAGLLQAAIKALTSAGRFDPAAAQLATDLREALGAIQAVSGESREILDRASADPEALDDVETRLALLEKLKTKYGSSLEEVLQYAESLREELDTLEQAEGDAAKLEAALTPLKADLETSASTLSNARRTTAGKVAPQLERIIRNLGMPKARLEFALTPAPMTPHGAEDIEIRFNANSGEDLGALSKIASGGELSRVMLALSAVLGANTPTVIFDEVDAGIGGAAASAVGDQLHALSRTHQVLVVTHLAQIAAKAQHHYKVEKLERDGRTVTGVSKLEGEARVRELARMLSGSASSTAMAHARELLGAVKS